MKKKQEIPKPEQSTEYCCPICNKPLSIQYGNQMYPGNKDYGVTLFCIGGDPDAKKHPQEVSGHGNGRSDDSMLKNAYSVLQARFCGMKLDTEGELTEIDFSELETVSAPEIPKAKRKAKVNPPVVEDDEI